MGSASWISIGLALLGLGCATPPRLPTPMPLPTDRELRDARIEAFGERVFEAIRDADAGALLFDDEALRVLLRPAAAARAASMRHNVRGSVAAAAAEGALFRGARYVGLCVQRARQEPADGPLGLRRSGWVFDRALVVAREPGGGRVAAWAEGTFLHTDLGLGALDLSRLEAPRRDHADLDLASCDLRVGDWGTLPVVVGAAPGY